MPIENYNVVVANWPTVYDSRPLYEFFSIVRFSAGTMYDNYNVSVVDNRPTSMVMTIDETALVGSTVTPTGNKKIVTITSV